MRIAVRVIALAVALAALEFIVMAPRSVSLVLTKPQPFINEIFQNYTHNDATAFIVGAVMLGVLALSYTSRVRILRVDDTGARIAEILKFVEVRSAWLTTVEAQEPTVGELQRMLSTIDARTRTLQEPGHNIRAMLVDLAAKRRVLKDRLDQLSVIDDENIVDLITTLKEKVEKLNTRTTALDGAARLVPELGVTLVALTGRADLLESARDGLLVKLQELTDKIGDLTNEDGEGTLDKLEQGVEGVDGDLKEQIEAAREDIKAVEEKLTDLDAHRGEIEALFADLRTVGEPKSDKANLKAVAS